MTNKKRANKIKKLLGLRGDDNNKEYYRVADVICDLMHYCDHNKIEFVDYPFSTTVNNLVISLKDDQNSNTYCYSCYCYISSCRVAP